MDPFHAKQVAEVERHLAEFIDNLANIIDSNRLNADEASYTLRFAAGTLRGQADNLELAS